MLGLLHQTHSSSQTIKLPKLNSSPIQNKRLADVLKADSPEAPSEEFRRLSNEPVRVESPTAKNHHGDTLNLSGKK